jgi:hypothetical protein
MVPDCCACQSGYRSVTCRVFCVPCLSPRSWKMPRLYSFGAGSFTALAFALALVLPLAVPDSVFADAGSSCAAQCQSSCSATCGGDIACLQNCLAQCGGDCCATQCLGDPNCPTNCCQAVCGGNPTCIENCLTRARKCMPETCALRDACKAAMASFCTDIPSCGAADGCRDVCKCKPLMTKCDCQP